MKSHMHWLVGFSLFGCCLPLHAMTTSPCTKWMSKVHFSMDVLRGKSMWSNIPSFKILRNLIMFTNSTKLYKDSNKLQEHGMKGLASSLSLKGSQVEKLVPPYSQNDQRTNYLWCKSLWTTFLFDPRIVSSVNNFPVLWARSCKWAWWRN